MLNNLIQFLIRAVLTSFMTNYLRTGTEGSTSSGNDEFLDADGEEYTFNMPACDRLSINAIIADATAITPVEHTPMEDNRYYTLDGRRVEHPTYGIYIYNGRKVVIK